MLAPLRRGLGAFAARRICCLALGLLAAGLADRCGAGEPVDAMLKALRRRGLHDVALDYLDALRSSDLVDDSIKKSIPYEEGCSLVERAKEQRGTPERLAMLEAARGKFEEFLAAQPDHPQSASASIQLGNLLIERARAVRDTSATSGDAAERKTRQTEALDLLNSAREKLSSAEKQFEDQLRTLGRPAPGEDVSVGQRRDELRRQLLQSRLFAAQALFESGLCHPDRGAERKRLLEEAAAAYVAVHEKYPQVLGGFYAQLWQGRCLAELRQWNQALAVYEEIRQRPEDDEDFRQLRARALLYAWDCWQSADPPQTPKAIEQTQAWLDQLRGAEDRAPDNLEIRWRLAQAQFELSKSGEPAEQAQHREAALAQARFVADSAGPRRREARQWLAQAAGGDRPLPANFADARQQAQEAVDQLRAAENQVAANAGNPEARAKSEAERDAAARAADAALRRQIGLRQPSDSIDDLNEARHHLAYVQFQLGDRYAAAALGEFLARRYPQSTAGRAGAKIALAAYVAEYGRLGDVDRAFEKAQLEKWSRYLAETWPNEPEANEAWLTLGDIAARERRFDDALAAFEHVTLGSPQRLQGDLAGGQIAWARYLEAVQAQGDGRAAPEELQRLQADARQRLEAAVSAARKARENGASATYTQLAGELSLAQLYAEAGEHAKALEVLDQPQDGVLALVAQRHALTERGNFPLEAQKVALRAAVGAGQLDRAQNVLKALGERAGSDPQGQAALARLYLALGRELQEQVERLRDSGRSEELTKLASSFELFLQKLSEHPDQASYESLEWAADTWYRLGSGLIAGDARHKQNAQKYLARSGELYEALLKRADQTPGFLPRPEMRTLLELRGAAALRAGGAYEKALERILAVLKRNPNQLEAQIEAAEAYQAWGAQKPEHYTSAMAGARPVRDKEGRQFLLVWGWAKLANALQRLPQHADRFLEARYNLAQCRYRLALTQQGAPRNAGLTAAERDIAVTTRLKSDLGPQWNPKFDALAKSIQKAAGRPTEGLRAVQVNLPATTPQASNR